MSKRKDPLPHRCLLLVLWHEFVLHLIQGGERLVILISQTALALPVSIGDLNFQSAGSFTEVFVVRGHIIASRVAVC